MTGKALNEKWGVPKGYSLCPERPLGIKTVWEKYFDEFVKRCAKFNATVGVFVYVKAPGTKEGGPAACIPYQRGREIYERHGTVHP
jgi:hypothetical protein